VSAEIIIDSFAGGGGASLGIELALGRSPDVAINHDAEAIALHEANHAHSKHYREDVWKVDPHEATKGRPVGLMWLSPDCRHFSKAKGGKPVSKRVRGLAWVAVRWAAAVKPRVIVLENVEEFTTWGPVLADTQRPCPDRKGKHFRSFKRRLERLGYVVDHKMLRACDYGAPTIRRRLFLIARCDGQPIVWPAPTHGPNRPLPWRTAAECIDWSIPCPSIFERKRPLAVNTLKRVAAGLRRYVLESQRPFIVQVQNASSGDAPISIDRPMRTVTAHPKGGGFALVAPTIVNTANGKTTGRGPNVWGPDEPVRTITAAPGFALVAPTLAEYHSPRRPGDDRARELDTPLAVQDTSNRFGLVSAFLAKHYGERKPGEVQAASLFDPLPTVTSTDHNAVVASSLVALRGGDPSHQHGDPLDAPLRTISAGGTHHAEVRAFLVAYYGNEKDGGSLFDPVRTVTSKERFGLVTVDGQDYAISDIGMRMLAPRELYRAQGFPDTYTIDIPFTNPTTKKTGPMTKTAQVRMCGNSVCPPVAAAIVRANVGELAADERVA
jgi:DNA (cytosine-5)-methyltransferase 1